MSLLDGGVYKITNQINNKIYIGSSVTLKKRLVQHKSNMKGNRHRNRYLQRAYNKYGEDNFVFEILIYCDPDMCIYYEQRFIDFYRPEYNLNPASKNCLGRKLTDEHKRNISIGAKGRKHSDETKRKIGKRRLGKKHSKEAKRKMSDARKNKPWSNARREAQLCRYL